jgi:hypothetical protein
MADMFICGTWTGQRQSDRLKLKLSAFRGGRFDLEQGKTNQVVNPPVAPEHQKRLVAAKRRRLKAGKTSEYAHLNEATWEPWNHYTYLTPLGLEIFDMLRPTADADYIDLLREAFAVVNVELVSRATNT